MNLVPAISSTILPLDSPDLPRAPITHGA
jgi:hypothetical protein